jgi:short-subunit dehydrogenase
MKRILIVGGANGIGLSLATELAKREESEKIYIVDKAEVADEYRHAKFETFLFDLTAEDYSLFDRFTDIDTLFISAGFGHLALFRDISEADIIRYVNVNTLPTLRLIKRFYPQLEGSTDFRCGVMVSIAGFMSSPFLSVYAATKAALKVFIESVNVELIKAGSSNRILNVSPGSIPGTRFDGGTTTDLTLTEPLTRDIIHHLDQKDDLFIPKYDEVFRHVLDRYHSDFRAEGLHSYDYKEQSGRIKN